MHSGRIDSLLAIWLFNSINSIATGEQCIVVPRYKMSVSMLCTCCDFLYLVSDLQINNQESTVHKPYPHASTLWRRNRWWWASLALPLIPTFHSFYGWTAFVYSGKHFPSGVSFLDDSTFTIIILVDSMLTLSACSLSTEKEHVNRTSLGLFTHYSVHRCMQLIGVIYRLQYLCTL